MKYQSCVMFPEINGKPSKMYVDLLKKHNIKRPLVNLIYANYLVSNAAEAMDKVKDSEGNPRYRRNRQGEHNAEDIIEFFDVYKMMDEMATLSSEELSWGIVDANGERVKFTSDKEAFEKADKYNDAHKATVATVVSLGDAFTIVTAEKSYDTLSYASHVKEYMKIWDVEKQAFAAVGIDIENVPQELKNVLNRTNATVLVNYLQSLQRQASSIRNLYSKKECLLLFSLHADSDPIRRLVQNFGSIDAAAEAVSNINNGVTTVTYTDAQKHLLNMAVNYCRNFNGIDFNALRDRIDEMAKQVSQDSHSVETVKKTLNDLNKKYNIEANEIHRVNNEITKLSDAAAEAAINIERQIRELKNKYGRNEEGKRLEKILDQLLNELANKRYYSGILNFLEEAGKQLNETTLGNMVEDIPDSTVSLEKAMEAAKILYGVENLRAQYYPLVSALAEDSMTIDEDISQNDVDNIRKSARQMQELFDKKRKVLNKLKKKVMVNLLKHIFKSETTPDGVAIVNVVEAAAVDGTLQDFLYSMGTVSNPTVAAMGAIVRQAQTARDKIMNDMSIRIRRATDKLYKSGSDSSFMYEDDGHIISDIDWGLYEKAKVAYAKNLKSQGLSGFEFKQALEEWIDLNTEDRVVDKKSGRTERVPDAKYRKAFPNLTDAQKRYYDEMMQLKGEIGTLLPAYAQNQYLPPQLRRKMLDAIGNAIKNKDINGIYKALKNKVENVWTIREDDENYWRNGVIDGNDYIITESDYNNRELRQIPIFFVNKVEQGELLKNFSAGIAALAGTAINYDAMNSIADVVQFVGDYVKEQMPRDTVQKGDMVANKFIRVFKDLTKWGKNTNTIKLIDGFIDQHIYGIKKRESGKLGKIWDNLLQYTSFKALTTNIKGAFNNWVVAEFQMMIEAGAGEFYNFKNFLKAHLRLFGGAGVGGEIAELLTNNMNHKSTLLRELFDPLDENFSDKKHTKYYKSMFRQLVSHDCSFIGYASGEFLAHYVNMYSVLDNKKVYLNGKKISLYDAFEVGTKIDGNSELKIKDGVTIDEYGTTPLTLDSEFIQEVRGIIRYVNHATHGAMNDEDKGIIHQYWWGRGIMNLRQWMVGHYSRRYRKRHADSSLDMKGREGMWISFRDFMFNEDTKEAWKEESKLEAIRMFMRDFMTFVLRAESQWSNLDDIQKYNVKRVHTEMTMFVMLLGLGFALGEPDEHKKEFWRRWFIYQTKRVLLEMESSMPSPKLPQSLLTILQSPMAGANTASSLLYTLYGLTNGDFVGKNSTIKSGPHKGENRYWRNVKKYTLPFFKDWEQMQRMDEDDAIFQVFKDTPSTR